MFFMGQTLQENDFVPMGAITLLDNTGILQFGRRKTMADSNITKHALAMALRELMTELPFEKINVAHICERCGMNRKSFYYHFKDKYDLVNWIFDTEIIFLVRDEDLETSYEKHWEFIEKICFYFYENHAFYRKALQIQGQNSFADHFREYSRPLLSARLTYLYANEPIDEFALDFFTDAIVCTVERWLLKKDCLPPEQFVEKIKSLTEKGAASICREMRQEKDKIS